MRNHYLLPAALLLAVSVQGQPFFKAAYSSLYDSGDNIKLHDNGYAVAGFGNDSNFYFGASLINNHANGNPSWNRLFRLGNTAIATELVAASDGGFVIAGSAGYQQRDTTFILKTNALGNVLWSKIFYFGTGGDCIPKGMIETIDGGYAVLGQYRDVNTFNYQTYLLKMDASGNILWAKSFFGSVTGEFIGSYDLIEDSLGNLYICGNNWLAMEGAFLMQADSLGDLQWARLYHTGTMFTKFPLHVSKRQDGSWDIVFGDFDDQMQGQSLIIHAASSGNILDATRIDVGSTGRITAATRLSNDNIALTGGFYNPAFQVDACILNLDVLNGSVDWSRRYGSSGYEFGHDIIEDTQRNLYMTGVTQADSFFTAADGFIPMDILMLKTDSAGTIPCFVNPLPTSLNSITITDAVFSIMSADITSSSLFASLMPQVQSVYEDTTACLDVGIDEVEYNTLLLMPNPAIENFTITSIGPMNVDIYNESGKLVHATAGTNEIRVNCSFWPKGFYFARITGSNKSTAKKIVIH